MSQIVVDVTLQRGDFGFSVQCTIPKEGVTALLGSSGSGKSTLLRIIAGLEKPDQGLLTSDTNIWYASEKKINRNPQQRRVGLVFQDYALFEHMTVAGNIGYGVSSAGRKAIVEYWLHRFELQDCAERYPGQLSGGQKQRVALARALAHEPDVLLLDEPFSAADPALRIYLRQQLKTVVQSLNIPVVMVTHDMDDIYFLADHVGVMVKGQLYEFGRLKSVLKNPTTRQAAEALGWQNFLPIRSIAATSVSGSWGTVELEQEPSPNADWLAIRPEYIRFVSPTSEDISLQATIKDSVVNGAVRTLYCCLQDGTNFVVHRPWDEIVPASGQRTALYFHPRHIQVLTDSSKQRRSRLHNSSSPVQGDHHSNSLA